jgi:hypothetical protein
LHARYRGGTGWAIDAAMHGSLNVVFVAAVEPELIDRVETSLIWTCRDVLVYNQVGKRVAPAELVTIVHAGDPPVFKQT